MAEKTQALKNLMGTLIGDYDWVEEQGLWTAKVDLTGGDFAIVTAVSMQSIGEAWSEICKAAVHSIPAIVGDALDVLPDDAEPTAQIRAAANALPDFVARLTGGEVLTKLSDEMSVQLMRFVPEWKLDAMAEALGIGEVPSAKSLSKPGAAARCAEFVGKLPLPVIQRIVRGIATISGNL